MPELFIFLIGLLIGSFLNTCIYRLPLDQSVITPSSHCDTCHTKLEPRDLIPIISFFLLKGRCRYCQAELPLRYVFVEVLTGLVFLWCYLVLGFTVHLVVALLFSSFMVVITFIDYDHRLILNKVLLWLAGTGAMINLITGTVSVSDMVVGCLVGGGVLMALTLGTLVLTGHTGMGMGDVKFMAVLGLWLGTKLVLLTMVLSFLLGGFGGMLLLALKIKSRKDVIPFGPYIVIGAWVAFLYGNEIITWYSQKL